MSESKEADHSVAATVLAGPEAASSPTPAPPADTAERWANIERLRIVAMLEIVSFHIGQERGYFIGGVGLATFLLLTNLFNTLVARKRGRARFYRDKVRRLAFPWIFWCGVYALLHIAENYHRGESPFAWFTPLMLLYGTEVHLWFVPFALAAGIAVGWLQSTVPDRKVIHAAVGVTAGGLALLWGAAWLLQHSKYPVPLPQYLYALPSPLLGMGLGLALYAPRKHRIVLLTVIAGFVAAIAGVVAFSEVNLMYARYSVMMLIIPVICMWPGRSDVVVRFLTPLLFGIYLIHPLTIRILRVVMVPEEHLVAGTLVVFVLSAFVIAIMRRTVLRRAT